MFFYRNFFNPYIGKNLKSDFQSDIKTENPMNFGYV